MKDSWSSSHTQTSIIKQLQHLWEAMVPTNLLILRSMQVTLSISWLPNSSYFSIPTSSSPLSPLYLCFRTHPTRLQTQFYPWAFFIKSLLDLCPFLHFLSSISPSQFSFSCFLFFRKAFHGEKYYKYLHCKVPSFVKSI